MKRVLLTGIDGFIGHHVAEGILKDHADWEIVGLSRIDGASTFQRLFDMEEWRAGRAFWKRVSFQYHNLRAPINEYLARQIGHIDIILHLAAGTHVDRSIDCPMEFVQDNVVATCNILDYARSLPVPPLFVYFSTDEVFGPAPVGTAYKEWDRYNSGNPYSATKAGGEELTLAYANTYKLPAIITHCHDDQTRAWTPQGRKHVSELSVGDEVWGLRDGDLVKTTIREIVVSPYQGPMVEISSSQTSQCVTPNHRVLVQKSVGKPRRWQPSEYVRADSLVHMQGRVRIPATGEWHCAVAEPVTIPQRTHHNNKPLRTVSAETIVELIGWFVAEGSTNASAVSLASISPKIQQRFQELFSCFGLQSAVYGRNVQCASVALRDYLSEQCGQYAENKHIPDWVLEYEPPLLRILFHALMQGDGTSYYGGKNLVYYTKSPRLAEQVAELGIKLGYAARICTRKTWNPRKTIQVESYVVRLRQAANIIEKKHVRTVAYDGPIWCLRTDEGNFFIEREGKITCSGNTMNVFGERQHPEKFIPKVIKCVLQQEEVTIHANADRTQAGSRFYIHARNVAEALLFLLDHHQAGDKYNIVGEKEVDNLTLAQFIAGVIGKPLRYQMVDFHSSRPGHDLRYALDGTKLKDMGFDYPKSFEQSLEKTVLWYLEHPEWLLDAAVEASARAVWMEKQKAEQALRDAADKTV
jgi:dTDP-D-glucose 4,6-dehydratase